MKVGTLPERIAQADTRGSPGAPAFNRLGLQVDELDDSERRQLGVDRGRGVIVERVTSGPAMASGIRRGDVITTLDNAWVHTVAEFEEMVSDLPAGVAIAVRIVREGRPQFLVVKIEE
jgi:serine protease Do